MSTSVKITDYFRSEKKVLAVVTVSGLAYNIGLLAGPYYQGRLVDAIMQNLPLKRVLFISVMFIAAITLVQAARAVKRFYVRKFANNVNAGMQKEVYANFIRESEDRLVHENMGSLMTKAVSDVDACVEGMRKFTTELFDTGVFLVSYLVTLFIYDWKLTIISCIFIPPALFTASRLRKLITGYTSSWRKSTSEVSERTYSYVDNAILYRITGREESNCLSYEHLNRDYEKKAILAGIWENSMMPIYKIISLVGVIAIIIAGSDKVIAGLWTVGQFTAYITMFIALADKASHAGKLFNSVQKAEVSWKRIKPFLGAETAKQHLSASSSMLCNDAALPFVSVYNVSFAWPESKPLFSVVNFTAHRGSIIGITGPVACGKSTLCRLFLGGRAYEGSIMLENRELSSLSDSERISLISYMGHDASLMTASIYENITLGDDGDVLPALHAVCFDEDLASMIDGIQTLVGNGGMRLSGGQQERIALARTLYHKKPVMILDDPFASVDAATEYQILSNMRTFCADCAVILVSHRLSQFSTLDGILLLDENGNTAFSTHENLIKTSPVYRKLYEFQQGTVSSADSEVSE